MRGVILIGGAAVLILALGVGGYLLGQDQAPTAPEAAEERDAAHVAALAAAKESAVEASFEQGRRDGLEKGRAEGRRAATQRGQSAGEADAGAELAAIEAEEAAVADEASTGDAPATEEPLVCDGTIADDALFAACAEQSGEPIPPGFPGGPSGCSDEPPYPLEGPCARP